MRPIYSVKGFSLFVFLFSLLFVSGSNAFAQCDGTFFKSTVKTILPSIAVRDTADFTGDGKLDLFAIIDDQNGYANKIYVVPGNGDGTFGAPVETVFPIRTKAGDNQIADFNGDGKSDYFVIFPDSLTVVVYQSNGDGTFTPLAPTFLAPGEGFNSIVDVNGDGRLDLATFQLGGTGIRRVRFGNADGSFGNTILISIHTEIEGDFNNDGKIDFVAMSGEEPPLMLRINYNQGNGVFTPGGNSINMGSTGIFDTADFNNDGKLDLIGKTVYPTGFAQKVSVLYNLGNDTFTRVEYPLDGFDPIVLGDFDGDGLKDFMTLPDEKASYTLFRNTGGGWFARREYNYKLFNPSVSGILLGDFNSDNKTDFLRVNNLSLNNVSLPPRIFNDTQISLLQSVCDSPGQTKVVDFNHDLRSDRTLWRETDGRWRINLYNTNWETLVLNWGTNGDLTAAGDYDGDGTSDVAVYRPSEGVWYIRKSSDGSYLIRRFGVAEDIPAAGDYNGDGRTDIAVFRPSEGIWYVLYSETEQVFIRRFGSAGDVPVSADYDGDGKIDLAVFRPSTNVWYYLKSTDGNYAAIQWGEAADTPAPGDFDGDGKADLCVYHASTGTWIIRRSYNLERREVRFGLAGDIPQIGDWNADGVSDISVYRPDTNIWYTFNSSSAAFGESKEIPVSSILRIQ
jgi:hypothetical protein